MDGLLDDEQITGPHAVRVATGPRRIAVPVRRSEWSSFVAAVEFHCQVWGGANAPFVPVANDGTIVAGYHAALSSADIDQLDGFSKDALIDPQGAVLRQFSLEAEATGWGRQFAPALLRYRKQKKYSRLTAPALGDDDPWHGIYAACLGLLPATPYPGLLRSGRLLPDLQFEDFVRVRRPAVTGSVDDLLARLNPEKLGLTPRLLTMDGLPQGARKSLGLSTKPHEVLPQPDFERDHAGPLVVVLCHAGNVEDHLLLWNLRGAYGDLGPFPIGIPAGPDAAATLAQVLAHRVVVPDVARAPTVLVTSTSVDAAEIERCVSQVPNTTPVVNYAEVLTFGPSAAWAREETLSWHDGSAHIRPVRIEDHLKSVEQGAFNRHTQMSVGVDVLAAPAPHGTDMRFNAPNWDFYAGAAHRQMSVDSERGPELLWPSRLLFAKAAAARRGLELRESEPGRAARVALAGMSSIHDIGMLAHAPLLKLLEDSAATEGISFYRKKAREEGREIAPSKDVAVSTDSLPQIPFGRFKSALGGSAPATKYWLSWAERCGLVIRGFQLQCESCLAKQWLPLEAFSLPLTCRGCGETMTAPFGDRESVQFTFRISERLRRVYRHEAMGHLLTLRFFYSVLGGSPQRSSVIGLHPGMELVEGARVVGEADVMILMRDGNLIPMEVKRSYGGMTDAEVDKLAVISDRLGSPWSALVVSQPGDVAPDDFPSRQIRGGARGHHRLTLSADMLLDPMPIWGLGSDPFAWHPLPEEERIERERAFAVRLAAAHADPPSSWLESDMLSSIRGS